ncbi:hypothetical protein MHYP_G00172920 [Metynnis hypsauchen]
MAEELLWCLGAVRCCAECYTADTPHSALSALALLADHMVQLELRLLMTQRCARRSEVRGGGRTDGGRRCFTFCWKWCLKCGKKNPFVQDDEESDDERQETSSLPSPPRTGTAKMLPHLSPLLSRSLNAGKSGNERTAISELINSRNTATPTSA